MRPGIAVGLVAASLALGGCPSAKPPGPKTFFTKLETKDVVAGAGAEAAAGDLVLVSYTGTIPGTKKVFDTNVTPNNTKDPLAFDVAAGTMVQGMDRGVIGMKVGGERVINVPYKLGYGDAGSPPNIPGGQDLIFSVKLLALVKQADARTFEYEDTRVGTGPVAAKGSRVSLHYRATYVNTKMVDDTRKRNKTVDFTIGKKTVVTGFDEGVIGMAQGGRRILTLPPLTAWGPYGDGKSVAGNQVIVFDVEMVSVTPGSP